MNLAFWLDRAARQYPARPALAHDTRLVSDYAAFAARAASVAGWLRAQGLAPGDRVALFMSNHPRYLELLWGAWWAGCCAVPINAKLHAREAAWIIGHAGAALCFTDDGDALREAGVACALHPDAGAGDALPVQARGVTDPAWLFYTSGTTGRPKGVVLASRQLQWATAGYLANIAPVAAGDVMLHPAPLSHGGGLYHLPFVMQGALNVVPESGGFDAAEVFALAAHWRRASFFAAPTMVKRLVDHAKRAGLRADGLATIIYGGGPMYLADIEEALSVIGPHFAQIYGQGEAPMTITVLPSAIINDRAAPRWRERLASVGHAQCMAEVSICDADGRALPVGESGEVCARGDIVMEGYWQDPDATARTIRDGWLYTGDVGRMDADGFLTLLDRSKDLVISGGTNIYPREVEEALLTHPDVAEVSVIGRADAEWGEVVVAYVVARAPVTAAALDAHCLERIARFKRPKHYRFVAELPKNNYGKVLKTALREMESRA